MLIFDAHSDILAEVMTKRERGLTGNLLRDHLPRLKSSGIKGAILVFWLTPEKTSDPAAALEAMLGAMTEEFAETGEEMVIVRSLADLRRAEAEGRFYALLGVEGLAGLRDGAEGLDRLYDYGLRHAGLTWNEENHLATGVGGASACRGLTAEGRRVLARMESLGMLIDVSHLNEKSFWDIIEATAGPIIASHSNPRALCGAPRNLTDQQIRAVAERGGVIGFNSWGDFIDSRDPTLARALDHIDYLVDLAGPDHVGFGFDFLDYFDSDPAGPEPGQPLAFCRGLARCEDAPGLIEALRGRGYTEELLEKIASVNFHRVLAQVL